MEHFSLVVPRFPLARRRREKEKAKKKKRLVFTRENKARFVQRNPTSQRALRIRAQRPRVAMWSPHATLRRRGFRDPAGARTIAPTARYKLDIVYTVGKIDNAANVIQF